MNLLHVPLLSLCHVAVLLASIHSTSALVSQHQIVHSSRRWTLIGQSGISPGGAVELTALNLTIYVAEGSPSPDKRDIGFLVASQEASSLVESQPADGNSGSGNDDPLTCPLLLPNTSTLFLIKDMGPPGENGQRTAKTASLEVPEGGVQAVYLINCATGVLVSANVELVTYSPGPGDARLYLPPGEVYLAYVDFGFSGVYLIMLTFWLCHVLKVWCKAVPPPAYQVLLTLSLPFLAAAFATAGAGLLTRQAMGASATLDWALDSLMLTSALLLLTAFFAGLELVDSYLTDVERSVLYVAVPLWTFCQVGLAMSSNTGVFPWLISASASGASASDLQAATMSLLQSGVIVSFLLLSVLLLSELVALVCSLVLSRQRGRARDDREDEGPFSKYYVQMSLFLIAATVLAHTLPHVLPLQLSWIASVVGYMAWSLFVGFTLVRVRPRVEKSVYQLFDENDSVDEELEEL